MMILVVAPLKPIVFYFKFGEREKKRAAWLLDMVYEISLKRLVIDVLTAGVKNWYAFF